MPKFIYIFFTVCVFQINAQPVVWPSTGLEIGQFFVNETYQSYLNMSIHNTDPSIYCNKEWVNMNYRLVREENGVYYTSGICPAQKLLFDFNALPNDTIWSTDPGPRIVLDTFTYTLLTGANRRALRVKGLEAWSDTTVWVEGIGSLKYGIAPYSDFEGGITHLICVRDSTGILYKNENWNFDCDSFLCEIPKIDFSVNCINGVLTTENNSTGADIYFWDFGDGATSSEFEPTHLYNSAGPFTVNLSVKASCRPDSTVTCGHEVTCLTVSLDQTEKESEWKFSPNPAKDFLFLKTKTKALMAEQDLNITIFDLVGRSIKSFKWNTVIQQPIYIGELHSGLYVVQIEDQEHLISKKILIVSRN